MEKITLSFTALAAIIAMTIPQACVGTAGKAGAQCAKPTLTPSDATRATTFGFAARASISFCFSAAVIFCLGTVNLSCEMVASLIRPSGF
jgi:hypothetical protein